MKPLTTRQIVVSALLLTVLVEGVTVFLRFGVGLRAPQVTASTVGRLTRGIRLHHGYFGIAVLLAAAVLARRRSAAARWLLVIGASLLLSDLIHHFLVLWPVTGSPQLDLVYP